MRYDRYTSATVRTKAKEREEEKERKRAREKERAHQDWSRGSRGDEDIS